jgi:hypothetical protein
VTVLYGPAPMMIAVSAGNEEVLGLQRPCARPHDEAVEGDRVRIYVTNHLPAPGADVGPLARHPVAQSGRVTAQFATGRRIRAVAIMRTGRIEGRWPPTALRTANLWD